MSQVKPPYASDPKDNPYRIPGWQLAADEWSYRRITLTDVLKRLDTLEAKLDALLRGEVRP